MPATNKTPFRLPEAKDVGDKPYKGDPAIMQIMKGDTTSANKLIALINFLRKEERNYSAPTAYNQLDLFRDNLTDPIKIYEQTIQKRCETNLKNDDLDYTYNPYRDAVDGIRFILRKSKSPFYQKELGCALPFPDLLERIKNGTNEGETVYERINQVKTEIPWLGDMLHSWVSTAEESQNYAKKQKIVKNSNRALVYDTVNEEETDNHPVVAVTTTAQYQEQKPALTSPVKPVKIKVIPSKKILSRAENAPRYGKSGTIKPYDRYFAE
jgi:hypothetical protein